MLTSQYLTFYEYVVLSKLFVAFFDLALDFEHLLLLGGEVVDLVFEVSPQSLEYYLKFFV